jgi:uncharacterized damage-inducible protein DinB
MQKILLKQIQFEHWANSELINTLKRAGPVNSRALVLLSHLLNASRMWLNRVKGEALSTTLFEERKLRDCEELLQTNTAEWTAYLEQATPQELERIVEFIFPIDNSKKKISVCDAILHVVNHASYHRGQIVSLIKGSIVPLPLVTYIVFASEKG